MSELKSNSNRPIAVWLLICAAVIFGMIVLGGVTRLTESGLSMVEWRPIMGVLPPMTDSQWADVFEKYQLSPEYQKVNHGMSLHEFKLIFYPEYFHRVLGRVIGLIFFFPFVYFLWRKQVPKNIVPKLWILFILGGLQGLLGWYMVKSGLVDVPRVSQYRLTAHLGLAVIIYAYMIWVALDLFFLAKEPTTDFPKLKSTSVVIAVLIYCMILSGGLVAGLDAGFAYNTFPLMDGYFFPPGLYNLSPAWLSMFEDITTVQFNHRIFAYCLIIIIATFCFVALAKGVDAQQKLGVVILLGALVLQVSLGIATLLLVVPVPLAAAHQGGAILILTSALYVAYSFRRQLV